MQSKNYTSVFTNITASYAESNATLIYSSKCANADYNMYKVKSIPEPNIALISIMLLFGTCILALGLKKLRRSNFFGSYVILENKNNLFPIKKK